jgi:hypothetical protein
VLFANLPSVLKVFNNQVVEPRRLRRPLSFWSRFSSKNSKPGPPTRRLGHRKKVLLKCEEVMRAETSSMPANWLSRYFDPPRPHVYALTIG